MDLWGTNIRCCYYKQVVSRRSYLHGFGTISVEVCPPTLISEYTLKLIDKKLLKQKLHELIDKKLLKQKLHELIDKKLLKQKLHELIDKKLLKQKLHELSEMADINMIDSEV